MCLKCVRLMIHTWIKDNKMHGHGIKCISKRYQTNKDEIRHFAHKRALRHPNFKLPQPNATIMHDNPKRVMETWRAH